MSQQSCSSNTPENPGQRSFLDGATPNEKVQAAAEVAALIEQVAHDLRSSLNAIQSWAYVLDRSIDAAPAPVQRALAGIGTGMQQQLVLIEEMEEAVRLLADESPVQWREMDLRDAADQALNAMSGAAVARNVALLPLEHHGPSDADYRVRGDPVRLVPLLRHLLMHCIWCAPSQGTVALHLEAEADQVRLRITESRASNSERRAERLAVLSDFFGRRSAGQAPRQSSALLLTRRMVELHGARLTAEDHGCANDDVTVCISVIFPRCLPGNPAA